MYYFEPKRKVANRIWATKNSSRPSINKLIRTVKKVLYAIFSLIRVQLFKSGCQKAERSQASSIKNVILRKLKNKSRRPKTGLKYVRLLHDNAPAHKARIVTDFLELEKVTVLPYPPYSPDLAPCDYFLFPKL